MKTFHRDNSAPKHFLVLLLALAGERANRVLGNRCNSAADSTGSGPTGVSDLEGAPPPRPRPFTRSRVVLRAFMSMMLSIRMQEARLEYESAEQVMLPRGAAFGVRYRSQ